MPALNIAKWDGTQWSALGSGINNRVLAPKGGLALYARSELRGTDSLLWVFCGPGGEECFPHDRESGEGHGVSEGCGNNLIGLLTEISHVLPRSCLMKPASEHVSVLVTTD